VVCSTPIGDGYDFYPMKPGTAAEADFSNASALSGGTDAHTSSYQRFLVFVFANLCHSVCLVTKMTFNSAPISPKVFFGVSG